MHEDNRKTSDTHKYSTSNIAGYDCTYLDQIGIKNLQFFTSISLTTKYISL